MEQWNSREIEIVTCLLLTFHLSLDGGAAMTPSKVDAIGLVTLMILVGASYFGFFRGSIDEQEALELQARQLKTLDAEHRNLLAELETAQQKLEPLRESSRAALAKPGTADRFLGELATVADKTAVTIRLLRPGNPQNNGDSHFMPIRIVAVAPFTKLYLFLNGLERIEQIATVEKLSVTGKSDNRNCEAEMLLHLHLPPGGKQGLAKKRPRRAHSA